MARNEPPKEIWFHYDGYSFWPQQYFSKEEATAALEAWEKKISKLEGEVSPWQIVGPYKLESAK